LDPVPHPIFHLEKVTRGNDKVEHHWTKSASPWKPHS